MPAETHVARGPVDPDDVFRVVRAHLAEILSVDEDEITLDTRVVDDLHADELAILDLVEAVEEEMGERTVGFAIDDDDLVDLRTVRDYVEYVLERMRSTQS
ncbi:MAG TPA: acyl carrier protein [Acidimicrobiia bacterium]|nr:acyl carrier protein [Acidimicrobiia bacterium]